MKWGDRYSADYANRLYSAVRRNLDGALRFICYTDDSRDIAPEIETHPLPGINIPDRVSITGWRKLSIWRDDLRELDGDILFLDLDIVVTGALDPFFEFSPGAYCVIENWTQLGRNIGNTSVFRFPAKRYAKIFDAFNKDPEAVLRVHDIEQKYISAEIPEQKFWPADWCQSFKANLLPRFPMNWLTAPRLPAAARVVAFTGHPDPHEARDGVWPAPFYKRIYKHVRPTPWIAEHWR
ncbi:MAG: hypothetical protein AAGC77_08045 [Pseudomonadota bacterium]